jgi:acetyl-CoA carboxylase biotin carboxyl carrier protein
MPKDLNKPDIDAAIVRKLAKLLDETGLSEIEFGSSDWHLRVSKGAPAPVNVTTAPSAPAPAVAPAAEASTPSEEDQIANHPGLMTSPMVGVVYTQPEPDSPPFAQVGAQVTEGQTVLLIEAMKVFNPIKAPRAGTVKRILVENGAPVEFGEPLLIIE